jgi:hydrogenase-4 component E
LTAVHIGFQLINLFAAILLLLAFAMLAQRRVVSLISLFAEQGLVLEMRKVETVELLADLEEEHAEDQHADEHVERDT